MGRPVHALGRAQGDGGGDGGAEPRKKLRAGSSLDDAPPREAAPRCVWSALIRGGLRGAAVAPFPDISAEFLAALIASLEEEMPPCAARRLGQPARRRRTSALAPALDLDAERGTTTLADLVTIVARIVQAGAAPQPDSGDDAIKAAEGPAFKARAGATAPAVGSFFARGGRLGGGGGAGEGGAHDAPNYNAEARDAGGFSGDAHVAHAVALAVEATLAATFSVAALADEADEVAAEPATATATATGDDATPRGVLAVARARAVGALESTWEPLLSALVVALEEARGAPRWALRGLGALTQAAGGAARRRRGRVPRRLCPPARAGRRAEASGAGSGFDVFVFVFGGSGQGGGGGGIVGGARASAGAAGAMGAVGSAGGVAAGPSAARGALPVARGGASRSGAPRNSPLAAAAKTRAEVVSVAAAPPGGRLAPLVLTAKNIQALRALNVAHRLAETLDARVGPGPRRAPRAGARAGLPRRRRRSRRRWVRDGGEARRPRGRARGRVGRRPAVSPPPPSSSSRARSSGGQALAALAGDSGASASRSWRRRRTRTPPLGRARRSGPWESAKARRRRRGKGRRRRSGSSRWNASWMSR